MHDILTSVGLKNTGTTIFGIDLHICTDATCVSNIIEIIIKIVFINVIVLQLLSYFQVNPSISTLESINKQRLGRISIK